VGHDLLQALELRGRPARHRRGRAGMTIRRCSLSHVRGLKSRGSWTVLAPGLPAPGKRPEAGGRDGGSEGRDGAGRRDGAKRPDHHGVRDGTGRRDDAGRRDSAKRPDHHGVRDGAGKGGRAGRPGAARRPLRGRTAGCPCGRARATVPRECTGISTSTGSRGRPSSSTGASGSVSPAPASAGSRPSSSSSASRPATGSVVCGARSGTSGSSPGRRSPSSRRRWPAGSGSPGAPRRECRRSPICCRAWTRR